MAFYRLIAAALLLPLTAHAVSPGETARQLAQAGLTDSTSYAVLESLTSEVGPRLAGTDAFVRAADWAQAKLKSLGFTNVHAEEFTMPAWVRGAESASIVAPSPQNLVVAALGGSVATGPAGIEAEIVLFRTYGDLLAAPMGSLTGKIAVVTQPTVKTQDGSGYGAANPVRRAGPSEAAKRGAVAYLCRSLGPDDHRLAHAGATNYQDGVTRIPAASLSNPDADQLERLASRGKVRVRVALNPTVNEAAKSWNVVGEIKGSEKPDEIVLIGGHLDSWDLGTGATDDGAGVAIVTAAAKLVSALPKQPKRTIRVVMFGAEEMNYSSAAYAKAHVADVGKIVIAGEADSGADRAYTFRVPPGALASAFTHDLENAVAPLSVYLDRTPALQGGSDTADLHAAGVPVVAIRQDVTRYFDTHHTADDTLDKVDPKQLAQATGVWAAFTYLAADSDIDFRALAANAK